VQLGRAGAEQVSESQSSPLRTLRPALFLDRDGTIIRDTGYLRDPDAVKLMPGAATALRVANRLHWPVIVITNQSGLARGLIKPAEYDAVRKRTGALLAEFGARIDAEYFCPHHPDFSGPCDCRKPGIALYEQAIRDHAIDAARSGFIGDRWRDVAPALHFGGRGILVPGAGTPLDEIDRAQAECRVAPTLQAAVEAAIEAAIGRVA